MTRPPLLFLARRALKLSVANLAFGARKTLYRETLGVVADKTLGDHAPSKVLGFTFPYSLGLDFPLDLCSVRSVGVGNDPALTSPPTLCPRVLSKAKSYMGRSGLKGGTWVLCCLIIICQTRESEASFC